MKIPEKTKSVELVSKTHRSQRSLVSVCVLPKDGLYPLPLLRRTEEKGTGILILNGPKQRSVDPGIVTAMLGSMVALKATLILSDSEKEELILNNRGQWPQNTLDLINKGVYL